MIIRIHSVKSTVWIEIQFIDCKYMQVQLVWFPVALVQQKEKPHKASHTWPILYTRTSQGCQQLNSSIPNHSSAILGTKVVHYTHITTFPLHRHNKLREIARQNHHSFIA